MVISRKFTAVLYCSDWSAAAALVRSNESLDVSHALWGLFFFRRFCFVILWSGALVLFPRLPQQTVQTRTHAHKPANTRATTVADLFHCVCVCMYVCMSMLVGICACVRLNQCQRQGRTLILCVLAHIHSYTRIHTLTHSHTPFHSILSAQKPPPNSKNYRKPSPPLSFREKDAFKTGVRNCDTVVGSQSAGRTAR